ncbi:MAG: response regulator [Gammaproteobacteria bacterium]
MAKILAVDDSRSMLNMVNYVLENAGYEVARASTGKEALASAKNCSFDMVISDVNMPEMDGFALVRALRQLPEYKKIPILMLTTESTQEKKNKGKQVGATGWIVKPFNPEQMLAVIQKLLN